MKSPGRLALLCLAALAGASPSVTASDSWTLVAAEPTVETRVPSDSSQLFTLGATLLADGAHGPLWLALRGPIDPAARPQVGPAAVAPTEVPTLFLGVRRYAPGPGPFGPPVLRTSILYRSSDLGGSWEALDLPVPAPMFADRAQRARILAAVSPADGALSRGYGLFASDDLGARWDLVFGENVRTLAASPDFRTIYAGTDAHGLWKSVDSGAHWRATNEGLAEPAALSTSVIALAVDPRRPETVYAVTRSLFASDSPRARLFRSADGGATWESGTGPGPSITSLVVLADPGGTLFAATEQGVFRSADGGRSWTDASQGLDNRDILVLAADPSSRALYAVTGSGLFRLQQGPLPPTARPVPFRLPKDRAGRS